MTVGPVDPAFTALWGGYRKALEDGTAKRAGEGVAFGHRVYWLRFSPADAKSAGSEVAVDAETFKPIVWRVDNGGPQPVDQHIVLAETTDLASADFTRRGPDPSLGELFSSSGSSGSLSTDGAPPSTTVPKGWLSAGAEADGHKLAAVLPQTVTTDDKKTIHGFQLVYGDLDHGLGARGATTVDELSQPDYPEMWARIPAGVVRIEQGQSSGSNGDHLEWMGYLVKDNRYITITTRRGEQALVEIARSLRPVG
jgi:hypothetical protein